MEVFGSGTTKVATTTSKRRQLSSLVWFVLFSYLSKDYHKSQIVQTLKLSFCVLLDVQGCSNQQTPNFEQLLHKIMEYLFVHFYVFGGDDLAYKLLGVVSFKRLPAALVLSCLMLYDEPGGRNCLAICAMTFSMDAIDLIFHVCWILQDLWIVRQVYMPSPMT
jgi:hypothetical protein